MTGILMRLLRFVVIGALTGAAAPVSLVARRQRYARRAGWWHSGTAGSYAGAAAVIAPAAIPAGLAAAGLAWS
jgi:hypothetical protein